MTAWQPAERNQLPHYSHPWLAELIFAFDRHLRRHYGVLEYSSDPRCIFRLEFCQARRRVELSNGVRLYPGDRVARLHYWNEHMPPAQQQGATIAWALAFHRRVVLSLHELALYLKSRSDLSDIEVICGDVPSAVREETGQIVHIMHRYGFETIPEPSPVNLWEDLRHLAENVLISLIVFAQNEVALRRDTLRRVRVPIYLSRAILMEKFGSAEDAIRNTVGLHEFRS